MTIKLDTLSKKFGKKIKIERIKQDISQEELAERSGLHRTSLGLIENGKNSPTLDSIARIANALNLTLPQMLTLD